MDNKRINIKEAGITLVALVVTIIVLLILAGVTITMALSGSGILNRATSASQTQDEAQIQEELQLALHSLEVDYYKTGKVEAEYKLASIESVKVAANKNGTFRDYIFSEEPGKGQEKLKAELGASNISFDKANYKITYKKLEFNVAENGTISRAGGSAQSGGSGSGNGGSGSQTGGPTIVGSTPQIGDSVNYNPGNKTTENLNLPEGASFYSGDEIDASQANDWVILDYNSTTKEVLIVPRTFDTTSLKLSGLAGYNNAVEALDMVAGIYLNTTYAKSSRSIRVEDANKLQGYDPEVEAATGSTPEKTWTWDSRYGMDMNTLRIIDYGAGHENEERTFKVTPTTTNYSYYLTDEASSVLDNDYNCFLASRYLLDHTELYFGLRTMDSSSIGTSSEHLWINYEGMLFVPDGFNISRAVCPVVSLKSGITMEKDGNEVWQLSVN